MKPHHLFPLLVSALPYALAACDTDGGGMTPEMPAGAPKLDVSTCSGGGWRPMLPSRQEASVPRELLLHDQRLYFLHVKASQPGPTIRSVPTSGGEPTVIQEGWPRGLWIEGGRLLTLSDADLAATPLDGGPAQTLLHVKALEQHDIIQTGYALDGENLYWAQKMGAGDAETWSVWRASRQGGVEESLGTLPIGPRAAGIETLVVREDRVIALSGAGYGHAYSVDKEGGGSREIARPQTDRAGVFGVADDGSVLWNAWGEAYYGPTKQQGYLVSRAPASGGGLQPYWSSKPMHVYPTAAVPRGNDGGGGWLVAAWELGTDDELHATLWAVDALGDSKRLACDPEKEGLVRTGALAPDALYTPVQYKDGSWQIFTFPLTTH